MWHIFDEIGCKKNGWFGAYQSYFNEYDIDPRRPVKQVRANPGGEYAHFDIVTRTGRLLASQYLSKRFFHPINDKPIEEGEYL